ncbi:MAG: hypothetical protein R2940_03100 [Syntrophotaleaceae bacterium]
MNIINPMLIIRSLPPAANAVATAEMRQYGLQPGQLVQATVAEGGLNSVVLDLNSQRLAAKSEIPLQTGQQLRLMVEESSPQLKLRLVKDSLVERLTHAIHLLEEKWDLAPLLAKLSKSPEAKTPALENLLSFFSGFEPSAEKGLSGESLKALIARLGLRMEADLAEGSGKFDADNLKSALLNILKHDGEGDPELSETVHRALQKIELFQLCNLRLGQENSFLIPLPLPFVENGFMTVEDGGRSRGSITGPDKVSLFLTLKNLGNLRIDMLHEQGKLFLRFTCASQDTADFVAGCEKELRSILTALPIQNASYCSGGKNFDNELIRRVLTDEQKLLNTRV